MKSRSIGAALQLELAGIKDPLVKLRKLMGYGVILCGELCSQIGVIPYGAPLRSCLCIDCVYPDAYVRLVLAYQHRIFNATVCSAHSIALRFLCLSSPVQLTPGTSAAGIRAYHLHRTMARASLHSLDRRRGQDIAMVEDVR